MTKEEFKKQTGYDLIEKDGKLYYDGDLRLIFSLIKTLPDNLTVNGSLELSLSRIEKLPNNLTVEGDLYLRNTPLIELPDDLIVNGNKININITDLKYNPEKIGFLFSKEIDFDRVITCYNIKKDIITCENFKGNLNKFIKRVHIIYFDKYDHCRIEYDQFIKECKSYKAKYLNIFK